MKNTVFVIALLSLIMLLNQNIYATDASDYGYYRQGGEIERFDIKNYELCKQGILEVLPNFRINDVWHTYYYDTFQKATIITHFPKDVILVKSELDYYYYAYKYDSVNDKLVQVLDFGYSYLITGHCSNYTDTNGYIFYPLEKDGYENVQISGGIPITENLANALGYAQTKDVNYLQNVSDFVEVPTPLNLSAYKASEENGIYLYWENDMGFEDGVDSVADGSKVTRLATQFFYIDASNETKIAQEPINENVNYCKRNQYFISLDGIDDYDTAYIYTELENWWIYGNVDVEGEREVVSSLEVSLRFDLVRDTVYISYVDDDDTVLDSYEIPITDYKVKNDSFTGGVNSSVSSLPSSNDGNYNLLDGLFNGFGLLGDNGLIACIGNLFSYIPNEIIILLGAGVSAMIIVALFKLLVK